MQCLPTKYSPVTENTGTWRPTCISFDVDWSCNSVMWLPANCLNGRASAGNFCWDSYSMIRASRVETNWSVKFYSPRKRGAHLHLIFNFSCAGKSSLHQIWPGKNDALTFPQIFLSFINDLIGGGLEICQPDKLWRCLFLLLPATFRL